MSAAPRRPARTLSPAPAEQLSSLGGRQDATPPDTHGAVGPNHLMTVLNTQILIQDKTGTVLSPAVSMDSFLGEPRQSERI